MGKQCMFCQSVACAVVLIYHGMLGGVDGCTLPGTCAAYDFSFSSPYFKNGAPYASSNTWVACPAGECLAGKYLKTDVECFRDYQGDSGSQSGANMVAPWTIVMKVKASSFANTPRLLDFSHSSSGTPAFLQVYILTTGRVVMRVKTSAYKNNYVSLTTGISLPLDVWTHVTLRARGTFTSYVYYSIYLNGTRYAGESRLYSGNSVVSDRVGIGCQSNGGARLAGYIADFVGYNNALSDAIISSRAGGDYLESNFFLRMKPLFFGTNGAGSMPCLNAVCPPVDECSTGAHNCAVASSVCTDTVDSFECACNAGYQGGGVVCAECSGGVFCPL
eukprot:3937536-Rhodomonas_salina.1